jgi:hypothetical protein
MKAGLRIRRTARGGAYTREMERGLRPAVNSGERVDGRAGCAEAKSRATGVPSRDLLRYQRGSPPPAVVVVRSLYCRSIGTRLRATEALRLRHPRPAWLQRRSSKARSFPDVCAGCGLTGAWPVSVRSARRRLPQDPGNRGWFSRRCAYHGATGTDWALPNKRLHPRAHAGRVG